MHSEGARVLLAHENGLFLMGVRDALVSRHYNVVSETRAPTQVLGRAVRSCADVVVLGERLGGNATLPFIARLRASHPGVRMVVVADSMSAQNTDALLEAGADAVAAASVEPDELAAVIHRVLEGESALVISAPPTHGVADAAGLTPRELEVLHGLGKGLRNDAIARELAVTTNTVKYHVDAIYRKLRVRNRIEAMSWSIEHGLVARPTTTRPVSDRAAGVPCSA
jgi:DNA-binding NarL/FixJ family response regulator